MAKKYQLQRLLICPRVIGDTPTKLRKEHCLQQTRLQYATAEKLGCSLYSAHAQVLSLGVNILVNVTIYPAF